MPTIDDLPAAVSVSDGDELVVSQSDVARKATRAQLLSGVQPALAVPTGNLLGRTSSGTGAPEAIGIGANLTLANNVLSAPPPFQIAALPAGGAPAPTDLVAFSQGGQNAAIPYSEVLAGLVSLPGVDISRMVARANGATNSRPLSSVLSDAITVEDFGAVGDGITDDTQAFVNAAASGFSLRLSGRVYVVNGAVDFATTPAVIGVPGVSTLRRVTLVAQGPWITVSGTMLAVGISFDAGGLTGTDGAAVTVTSACMGSTWIDCNYTNATGSTGGCGLMLSTGADTTHRLSACSASRNALHGIYCSGGGAIHVDKSFFAQNSSCGIRVDGSASAIIRDCDASGNDVAISVGNWNGGAAPTAGSASCVLTGNRCSNNQTGGIGVSAVNAVIAGNAVSVGSSTGPAWGMVARLGASRIDGNAIIGGLLGLDARGCWGSLFTGHNIMGAGTAVTFGGSQNVSFRGNYLSNNGWGVVISAIEPALSLSLTSAVSIDNNWIGFTTAQGGGICVSDCAQGIAIVGNDVNGWGSALRSQALSLNTDAAIVRANRWNGQYRETVQGSLVAGLSALVISDAADEILIQGANSPVLSIITEHQAAMLGQVGYIKVQNGGSGYTQAQFVISGSGTGAAATAVISNGQVLCITVTNPGSGYGLPGSPVTVSVSGDGTGAAATAMSGLPPLEGRRLHVSCSGMTQFGLVGSKPPQQSWTEFDFTIPAFGSVEIEAAQGAWRATSFPPVDYLAPTGDGGAVLQSVGSGNVVLRPGAGGTLALSNAEEPTGCTSTVGRGSPAGRIVAPPGSDFRNLNGGAGNTYWIKQSATDATGWVAVA